MEEGVLNLFHDSQDDMKKTINWLTAVLCIACIGDVGNRTRYLYSIWSLL